MDTVAPEDIDVTEQAALSPERVVRSALGGKADLELSFAEFFGGPFTLSAWFQPEYLHGYEGPILAENGTGRFTVGLATYSHDTPMLMLRVGQKQVTYRVPNLEERTWNHLAVTRSNFAYPSGTNTFSVYLNGTKLVPQHFDHIGESDVIVNDPEIAFSSSDPITSSPSGNVRIGRRTDSTDDTAYWNFYGLVDEVAVYTGAMPIATLAASRRVVDDTKLVKGFTFDSVIETNPKLRHATTLTAPTTRAPIDGVVSVFDQPAYASPTEASYVLPFAPGQAWKAAYGYGENSHVGGSAYCWDFQRVGVATQDTLVYAAADGDVVLIDDSPDDDPEAEEVPPVATNQPWKVQIVTGTNEKTSYLHLRQGSIENALCANGNCPTLPSDADPLPVYATQRVGNVGTSTDPTNSHLHFGMRTILGAETHTAPMAFVNYETCDLDPGETVSTTADLSKCSWRLVTRGTPRKHEIIRRP